MLAVSTNVDDDLHDTGRHHPERHERLIAAWRGLSEAGLDDALLPVEAVPAEYADLARVHTSLHLERIERLCADGGGYVDPDTPVAPGSCHTARLAAGAGLAVIDALQDGRGEAGLVLVRPPGHHATSHTAMGFCLVNNIAVAAARLTEQGERVLIVDWDVHHGNGTQDIFYDDPAVLFVSTHQHPHYPGTGRVNETGGPHAPGGTINFPFPAGTTGDVVLAALDEVVAPAVERFAPTWVLVSAGYDAHRDDPLADLALTAGDFADIAARVAAFAPSSGRVALFLEGGYDLDAVTASVGASCAALLGRAWRPESASSGGPGAAVVAAVKAAAALAITSPGASASGS